MASWRGGHVPQLKRWHILSDLYEEHGWEVGVEVGVKEGENLFFIMDHCPNLRMIGVDAWEKQLSEKLGENYATWGMDEMYSKVVEKANNYPNLSIMKSFSVDAAKEFDDKSFDFVFIDAQHTYDSLTKDIKAWSPKVKDGGMLLGHDIHFPGVLQAVRELVPDYIELENFIWQRPITKSSTS